MEKQKKKIDTKYLIAFFTIIAFIFDILCIKFSFWKQGFFCTRLIAFMVATNVFLKQLTNQDKVVSKWGTVIICLSSAVLSGVMNFDVITFGEFFLIFLNKLTDSEVSKNDNLKEKNMKKALYVLGIFISILAYLFTFDLSLEIAFGYVFLALAIWIFIKNKKKYKITLKNCIIAIVLFILIITICCVVERITGLFSQAYEVYNTAKIGNGLTYNFSYVYNFLLPYKDSGTNYNFVSMLSVFPVPIILAMVYLYKKEKHEEFLFPMICVIALEFIYSMVNLPNIINIITGLSLVSVKDATLGVAIANIYVFLYMYANVEEEAISFTSAIRITLLLIILNFFVPHASKYSARAYDYLFTVVFTLESFLMLCYTDNKYKKVSLWFLALMTIIGIPIMF